MRKNIFNPFYILLVITFLLFGSVAYADEVTNYFYNTTTCPKSVDSYSCGSDYIILKSPKTCKTGAEMTSAYNACHAVPYNGIYQDMRCDYTNACWWPSDPNSPTCSALHRSFTQLNNPAHSCSASCVSGYTDCSGTCTENKADCLPGYIPDTCADTCTLAAQKVKEQPAGSGTWVTEITEDTVGGGADLWTLTGADISYSAGNVGIGTTTPGYYRLYVKQTGTLDDTGIRVENGTATKSMELRAGASAGIIEAEGTSDLSLVTGGMSRIYVLSATGNVGIGTTPVNKLDVEGGVAIGATYSGTNAAPANGLIVQGNVGIGTTAPSWGFQLHKSATAVSNYVQVTTGDTGATSADGLLMGINQNGIGMIGTADDRKLDLMTNGSSKMAILSNGNVGIGIVTPTQKLDVNGDINVVGGDIFAPGILKLNGETSYIEAQTGSATYGLIVRDVDSTSYGNIDANDGYLTIGYGTSDGPLNITGTKVGVGTNTPQGTLHLHNASTTGMASLKFSTNTSTDPDGDNSSAKGMTIGRSFNGNSYFTNYGDGEMEISVLGGTRGINIKGYDDVSGGTELTIEDGTRSIAACAYYNLVIGSNNILMRQGSLVSCISSLKYKHNIQNLDFESFNIYDLRPVSFEFNEDVIKDKGLPEGMQIGLIAEELEDVMPKFVIYDEDGNPDGIDYVALKNELPLYFLKAIQDQKKQIDDLQKQIDELKK